MRETYPPPSDCNDPQQDTRPSCDKGDVPDCCAGRMTARDVLLNRLRDLRRQACGIQALLDNLPAKMSIEADEALWELLRN